jgi:prephenate dehydrogenase
VPHASLPDRIGIVGLGLVGSSLARAGRMKAPHIGIVAVEPQAAARRAACSARCVDVIATKIDSRIEGCAMVFLCTPIAVTEQLLHPVSMHLRDGAVITDVCGAKENLVDLARRRVRAGVEFVGGHPLFGGTGGFRAARPQLWQGGTVAVCTDGCSRAAFMAVARFHRALGARVVPCEAAEHDAAVALTSHLPYLLATTLSLCAGRAGRVAAALRGPGFSDMTRLAELAFAVQGEVARRNRHLPRVASDFVRNLHAAQSALAHDPKRAQRLLDGGRRVRQKMMARDCHVSSNP